MTIFAWLIIGHFIGDWMFQNDWMARDKRGRWWSAQCVVHCLVYAGILALVAWLGSGRTLAIGQLSLIFCFILLTHWLIDGFNLAHHWGRIISQTQSDFVRIVVDQTIHLLVLGVTASIFFP
ncbi:MAG: DUF3307 domain-containing protein [Caldilinea sp.]|uniref:DUF3307 domain-containing protein n=1 Tax=Caldilinea sp. TaxID=2293560 RepID=UPI002B7E13EC|nr:DUF3307 domain-containing protein [Caldilinea sp.]